MSIRRREIIKSLVCVPTLFATRGYSANLVPFSNTVTGTVNILIHGLFFMQGNASNSQKWQLEIFAPQLTDHHVFGGSWENVRELTQDVDLTSSGLSGKNVPAMAPNSPIPADVETSIPQFSRDETKVGDLTGPYSRKITLPWPKTIKSLRRGDFDTYFRPQATANSTVGDNITKYCKGQHRSALLGTVPCLIYDYNFPGLPGTNWSPTVNYHFYHEPCSDPTSTTHVNSALDEAAKLFQHSDKFKLILGDPLSDDPVLPGSTDDQPVSGVKPEDDEMSLSEDLYYSDWTSVCPHQRSPQKRKHIEIFRDKNKKKFRQRYFFNVSPANCPNFYVG